MAGFAVAWLNLGTLGVLIGWNGGSRAYSVGLHTLFRDHAAAVVVALVVILSVAGAFGRLTGSPRDLGLVMLFVLVADLVAGIGVFLLIDEIRRSGDVVRVVYTETVGFTQLGAALIGLLGGYVRRPRTAGALVSGR